MPSITEKRRDTTEMTIVEVTDHKKERARKARKEEEVKRGGGKKKVAKRASVNMVIVSLDAGTLTVGENNV
jgi:hypothetical protein